LSAWLSGMVIGSLATIGAGLLVRNVVVPRAMLRLFIGLPKTMRFDRATPQSMRMMVVLAEPRLEPWFSEAAAGRMLTQLRTRFPERQPQPPLPAAVRGVTYHPASGPAEGVSLPPEHGPLDGVLLAWPWHYPTRWQPHRQFVGAIVNARGRAVIATPEDQDPAELIAYLSLGGIDTGQVDLLVGPVDDVWVRDYGPTFVALPGGGHAIVANPYVPAEHPYRKGDNAVPFTLGAALGLPVHRLPLVVEGGNMVTDGHGLMVMTTSVLERNPELDEAAIRRILQSHLGCGRVHLIEPLPAEVTGHADMVLRFLDPHNVVVASAPRGHRWAGHFDRVATGLSTLPAHDGTALTVHRLRIAPGGGSAFWSHVNCTQVNGHVVVPTFGVGTDAEAMDFYRRMSTGTVTGIDFSDFLVGSVHCQSKEIPAGALPADNTLFGGAST